jgi:SAM-dependent methyltransferase
MGPQISLDTTESKGSETPSGHEQAIHNAEVWSRGNFVRDYAKSKLRPPEAALFDHFSAELAGTVLELGCGAGRVTGHLIERAREVEALDLSPLMVEYCRQNYPRAKVEVGDLSDLSRYRSGSFDAVVASACVLDVLDDADRRHTLAEIRRLLTRDGVLIASFHNLHYAPRIARPTRVLSRSPMRMVRNVLRTPVRIRNLRNLRGLQHFESDYAVLVDEGHEFSLLHYYISRDAQERQFSELGFALLECLDMAGAAVGPGQTAASHSELHYAARRLG